MTLMLAIDMRSTVVKSQYVDVLRSDKLGLLIRELSDRRLFFEEAFEQAHPLLIIGQGSPKVKPYERYSRSGSLPDYIPDLPVIAWSSKSSPFRLTIPYLARPINTCKVDPVFEISGSDIRTANIARSGVDYLLDVLDSPAASYVARSTKKALGGITSIRRLLPTEGILNECEIAEADPKFTRSFTLESLMRHTFTFRIQRAMQRGQDREEAYAQICENLRSFSKEPQWLKIATPEAITEMVEKIISEDVG